LSIIKILNNNNHRLKPGSTFEIFCLKAPNPNSSGACGKASPSEISDSFSCSIVFKRVFLMADGFLSV